METNFITKSVDDATIHIPTGLSAGKMGICLYLFHAGQTDKAREWLQAIYQELPAMNGNIQVGEGLCGIGIAINHLLQKGFIKGEANAAFQEIDNRVFRQLAYEQHSRKYGVTSLVQMLYYLTSRWKAQNEESEEATVIKSLITQVLNDIYSRIDLPSICEPLFYSLDYALPQVLFGMSHLLGLNLCRQRIGMMLKELSPVILSTLPRIQANRLYLLCGMNALAAHGMCTDEWQKQTSLLFDTIDIEHILTKEMGSKSIYVSNGASSLYFLIGQIEEYAGKRNEYGKRIMQLIDNSPEWKLLKENKAYRYSHLGLYNGICGTAWAYQQMEKQLLP